MLRGFFYDKRIHLLPLGLGGFLKIERNKLSKYEITYLNDGILFDFDKPLHFLDAKILYYKIQSYMAKKENKSFYLAPANYQSEIGVNGKMENLIKIISEVTKIPLVTIMARNRQQEVVQARQLFCYIAYTQLILKPVKKLTTMPKIAAFINQDHSSVYHSVMCIKNDLKVGQRNSLYLLTNILERWNY